MSLTLIYFIGVLIKKKSKLKEELHNINTTKKNKEQKIYNLFICYTHSLIN